MEKIINIVDINKLASVKEKELPNSSQLDLATANIVNSLFRELIEIFKWPANYDFDRAKVSWIKGFMAAKINTIEHLRLGIQKCRTMPDSYAPTCGQFIDMCKPSAEDLGLLSASKAFEYAMQINSGFEPKLLAITQEQERIIRHVIAEIGSFEFRRMESEKAKRLFEYAYNLAIKGFNDIPKALVNGVDDSIESRKRENISARYTHLNGAEANLRAMRELLGVE